MKIIKSSPLVCSRSHPFPANVRRFTAVLLGLLLATTGFALPKTWDGSSNGNWNTAANWTGNVVPANGDDLIFPSTAVRLTITNDFPNLRVNSITFDTGTNYVIRGNPITLTNGIAAQQASPGANTIELTITNAANQTFTSLNAGASLTLSGVISGTGGIAKLGAGTLIFSGGGDNTYTGATSVQEGVLQLSKLMAITFSASLTIGDGVGGINADEVRYTADSSISLSTPIIINESGLLNLNGFDSFVGLVTLIGGDISTGTGTLILGNHLAATSTSAGGSAVITGNLALGGTRTFTVTNGPSATDLNISAAISGTGGITKEQDGRLSLFTSNSFSGALTVNDGVLRLLDDFATGTTAGGVVLNGDSILELTGDINVGAESLTNNSTGQAAGISLSNLGGTNSWAGKVVLQINTGIGVVTNSTLDLSGAITGAGALTKLQPGTLVFSDGSGDNTYTGATSVEEGVLVLAKPSAIISSASLTIGDGIGGVDADVVRYTAEECVNTTVEIIINESGLLDLNGFDSYVGSLTLIGGDISTGTGTLRMAGNVTAASLSGNSAIISGNLALGGATRTFTVTNGVQTSDLIIAAAISGTGGMIKAEAGTLRLASSNSFSGAVTVNDGALRLENNFAVGTTAGGVTVNGDAILELINGTHVGAETLTLNNNSGGATSALSVPTGNSNSWAGSIILQMNTEVNVVTNGTLNLLGVISGAGTLTKANDGTLIYSGGSANTYTNTTTVNAGTLLLNKSVSDGSIHGPLIIGDGAGGANADVVRLQAETQLDFVPVTVNSSGLFDVNGISEGFGSLAGSGNVILGSGVINFGFDNTSTVFSGVISETGNVAKSGSGTMTLSGNNTYTGTTFANDGKLIVDGSQPQSPVSVAVTGTLGGTGTVGIINNISGGVVAPGASPGILTCSNVNFSGASSDFRVELNGTTAGTGYDQLNVRGTNNLGGSTLNVLTAFPLADAPAAGNTFTIINNDGSDPITGTFTGSADNSTFTVNNLTFRIDYDGGTGNDVVLTLTNVPAADAGVIVTSGNGSGVIDPNECALISVVVSNRSASAMLGVTGFLRSLTPGVAVVQGVAAYPDIPASPQKRTNSAPFQISVATSFVCGSNVFMELVLQTATHSTFAIPVTVKAAPCITGSGICELCPDVAITSAVGSGSLQQPDRLFRQGSAFASTCGFSKVCPGPGGAGVVGYDAFTFKNGPSNACITVTLDSPTADVMSVAYSNTYNPANLCLNYAADSGNSTQNGTFNPRIYSLNVMSNATFVIVVNEELLGDGGAYTLTVTGGDCRPALNVTALPGNKALLDWTTAAAGYQLESTNVLVSGGSPIWPPVTNVPVVINSRFNVTNNVTPSNQFYRLRKLLP